MSPFDASTDTAPPSADTPAGACTWRVGEVRDLPLPRDASLCLLADLEVREGGAWALLRCERALNATRSDVHVLYAVERDGRSEQRGEFTTARERREVNGSVVMDAATGRRGAIIPGAEGDAFWQLDAMGRPLRSAVLMNLPRSFPHSGHSGLAVSRDGYTCLADQVRGAWGASLIHLSANGTVVRADDLDLPSVQVPYQRSPLRGGAFALTWVSPSLAPPGASLKLRMYDATGTATRGERPDEGIILDTNSSPSARVVVAPYRGGHLALWESLTDMSSRVVGPVARTLDAQGTPNGERETLSRIGPYAGALAAAEAQGDVVAVSVTGSGVLNLVAFVFLANGARSIPLLLSRIDPMFPTAMNPANYDARVVPVSGGAMVAFQRDARTVSIATIGCAR
jgi:hypothetical protein